MLYQRNDMTGYSSMFSCRRRLLCSLGHWQTGFVRLSRGRDLTRKIHLAGGFSTAFFVIPLCGDRTAQDVIDNAKLFTLERSSHDEFCVVCLERAGRL